MRYYTHDTGGEIVYQIGDKVVHPMHGAGVIDSIVQRKVAGKLQEYYLLKLSVGSCSPFFSSLMKLVCAIAMMARAELVSAIASTSM